jgi:hypothetical protein
MQFSAYFSLYRKNTKQYECNFYLTDYKFYIIVLVSKM